jgi:site-specific DNA-methyltransferase (adenine-specific)
VKPYFEADGVQLWHGDCRDVLPALGLEADVVIADPPYGCTPLAWDRWPDGWIEVVATVTHNLWCFGNLGMFIDHAAEFAGWTRAQNTVGEFEIDTVIWEKNTGSGFATDRFKVVHELIGQWYQGRWDDLYREPQRMPRTGPDKGTVVRSPKRAVHTGSIDKWTWIDDGTRLVRSVIKVNNLRGRALHPTEKPAGILRPLVAYSCPPGGLVVDPFAGSGSTLAVAREMGRRAVGIEADERYCEVAARRLSAAPLPLGEAS